MNAEARLGAVEGLFAAALFGLSAPLSKLLLVDASPLVVAGLLYLGAGLGLTLYRLVRPTREAKLTRADLPLLAATILVGGMAGPLLLLVGLARLSATTGALLLNLEAPFTMLLAVTAFREHLSRRELLAGLVVVAGAALVGFRGRASSVDLPGALSIAAACLCWGVDNNLTQRLSLRDPATLVRAKGLLAGASSLGLGVALGGRLPGPSSLAGALLVGAACYGASIVLDVRALRHLGAAREAAFFATAPFAGALGAALLFREWPTTGDLLAAAVMAAGVVALLRARHAHAHTHAAETHEHLHVHDEHHRHEHEGPVEEPHAHPHTHAALTHDHPHVSDAHHRHRH